MSLSRRQFLGQALALLAAPAVSAAMPHLVLLGDSIFDNGSYTGGKPDVVAQVRQQLPADWRASLLAVDGATTAGIDRQLAAMPHDASHLVMSVGGNDALGAQSLLGARVDQVGQAMLVLADAAERFERDYRKAVAACLRHGLPLVTCTVYNGNFTDPAYQRVAATALTVFNDAILRVARDHALTVLDLRVICSSPADYANQIEPSSRGGEKIAKAIAHAVTRPDADRHGARVLGLPT